MALSLPGNDFFREEFHCFMPVILFGIAVSHNRVLVFLIYVFSSLYHLYGSLGQLEVLQSNAEQFFDSAVLTANQEEAWGYLYSAMITWLSTFLICAIVIRHWWKDDFISLSSWRNPNILSWVCILNAFTVVLSPSVIEFWLLTHFISDDWGVVVYFLVAVMSRIVFTLYQGYLYVFDRTKSDIVTYALTGVSNGVLMTTNVFFIYNVSTVYWRMAKLSYVQVLVIVSVTVASIDIVYRLMLLRWCLQKVVSIDKNVAMSQKGVRNTEVPPKKIPVYGPYLCQRHLHDQNVILIPVYQVILIGYGNFPPMQTFVPPNNNIIYFAHQPLHDPPHNSLISHYIENYGHFNTLVEQQQ